jgi:two-component system sensor histidine kinase/response regulator
MTTIRRDQKSFYNVIVITNFLPFLIGILVILGWIFDIPLLKSVLPHFIAMKFNTAICLLLLAAGNISIADESNKFRNFFSIVTSLIVLGIVAITLIEYQFHWNAGIDELFFHEVINPEMIGRYPPGRMAPITATMFFLIATARIILFHSRSAAKLAQFLYITSLIIAFQALVSYFFGITYTYGVGYYTQIALHTAFGIVCLSVGSLCMRPKLGWMEILTSDTAGGVMGRNLITWAILVPPLIQWLNVVGQEMGLIDDNFAGVLRVTGNIVFFTSLVIKNASALHESSLEQMKNQEEKLLMLVDAKAAKDIKINEEKFHAIFEASFDAIIGMDAEGRMTDCNHQAEKIFGWKKNEIIGKKLGDMIVPPEFRELHERGLKKFLATGIGSVLYKTIEVDALRANGERFPIQLSITPINLGGKYLFMGFIADITERKRTHSELIHAKQEALDAAHAKSAFLANMSHEIRTPLNGIIGMTDLLLETSLNELQKKYAKIVQSSGTGLLGIINDVLDFSKIDAGKMKLEIIPFNPTALVEEQTEVLSTKASAKNLPLLSYILTDVPKKVKGDPGRIGQILLNLISNAIKFTESGRITVKVSARSISADKSLFLFEVIDTGIGLTQEQCNTLFMPFTQADDSTARKYGGTGLGLSISRQLTELMGGRIWIESTLGSGSTFSFEIPLEVIESSSQTPIIQELHNFKAIVIDDDPVAREIICHYLKAWKMPTLDFATAALAWDWLLENAHDPDVIILDKMMPEMSGIELAIKLSEHEKLKEIPRILITAYEKIASDSSDYKLFKTVLGKPLKQSDLYNTILTLINKDIKEVVAPQVEKMGFQNEKRILVAEDNAVNQLLTSTQLKKLGYGVHVVANGLEVLQTLAKTHYDLILMDCQMPEMDGYEATRKIRELEKTSGKHITIVALTANAMKEDEEYCLKTGMDDFLSKPIKKDVLGKVLEKWLQK